MHYLITFFASFSAFCLSFSSFFLLSFFLLSFDDAELAVLGVLPDDFDVLGVDETVYGLNPNADGLTLAGWVFDLLINVAFDMIGATFELFMLSFFVACVRPVEVDGSSSNGTISDAFIAFDDDDV